jgi:hypothetical protein
MRKILKKKNTEIYTQKLKINPKNKSQKSIPKSKINQEDYEKNIHTKKNPDINTQKLKINPKNKAQKLKRFKRKIHKNKKQNKDKNQYQ